MEKIRRIIERSEKPEEKIEKIVSISYDGKQFLLRIPNKISDFLNIHKKDKVRLTIDVVDIEKSHEKIMAVEFIENK